jgi:hypothetical protein
MLTRGSEEVAPSHTDLKITASMLTILPQRWSTWKTENESGATNYMVRKTIELVNSKRILSTPNPDPD